nr:mucin-3A-like isoform X2 [Cherax quadricarinatus]
MARCTAPSLTLPLFLLLLLPRFLVEGKNYEEEHRNSSQSSQARYSRSLFFKPNPFKYFMKKSELLRHLFPFIQIAPATAKPVVSTAVETYLTSFQPTQLSTFLATKKHGYHTEHVFPSYPERLGTYQAIQPVISYPKQPDVYHGVQPIISYPEQIGQYPGKQPVTYYPGRINTLHTTEPVNSYPKREDTYLPFRPLISYPEIDYTHHAVQPITSHPVTTYTKKTSTYQPVTYYPERIATYPAKLTDATEPKKIVTFQPTRLPTFPKIVTFHSTEPTAIHSQNLLTLQREEQNRFKPIRLINSTSSILGEFQRPEESTSGKYNNSIGVETYHTTETFTPQLIPTVKSTFSIDLKKQTTRTTPLPPLRPNLSALETYEVTTTTPIQLTTPLSTYVEFRAEYQTTETEPIQVTSSVTTQPSSPITQTTTAASISSLVLRANHTSEANKIQPPEPMMCDYSEFHSEHSMILLNNTDCNIFASGVSEEEIKQILRIHNNLRSQVARGEEQRGDPGSQPQASDMKVLRWNRELATVAQAWANQCQFEHDGDDQRRICSRDYDVGQNLFYEWSHYPYPMIRSETREVGCGAVYYSPFVGGISRLYVCNYGPSNHKLGEPLYKEGLPATECGSSPPSTLFQGLCD